ncbi:MAG: hypothetical protein JF592_18465 [Microbacterium sp.]|uniref:hypothetical protein n=1 Tax=Microbacterium sp. TaxID=51671 RepID=UPI001E001772|nr:hypothetical protein [Microbacterium sp.]MBW8764533.1 hypothetical protein [Microbacterium sp.]
MFDLAIPVIHTAPGVIDAASVIVKAAIDTSFASDPAVKFVTRIAGIIFLIVLIIRGLNIYADKSKRGELITEALVGILCVGFIFFPEALLTIFGTLWGFVAGWLTGQA